MSATIGVSEYPKTRRMGSGVGVLAALLVATGLVVGALIVRAPSTAPAPKVVTIQTSVLPAWLVRAEQAGYTGRLGGVAPAVSGLPAWQAKAEQAGFTGRLGAVAPVTQSTPRATSPLQDWTSQQALRAAR